MEQLRPSHRAALTLRAMRFLAIRLKSRPETASLLAAVSAAREQLAQADDAFALAQEERIAATAEINYLDGLLDEAVMALSRDLYALTRGDRTDPRYTKLFPQAPSTAMGPVASSGQERFVQQILSRLAEDNDYAPLASHAKTIKERLELLKAALSKREALYQPEAKAGGDRRVALDATQRAYNGAHPQLKLLFPQDRALVESFFMPLRGAEPLEKDEAAAEPVAT